MKTEKSFLRATMTPLAVFLFCGLLSGMGQVAALQQSAGTANTMGRTPLAGHAAELLSQTLVTSGSPRLVVTSPGFRNGMDIPKESTQYGGNVFPGLHWSPGPAGTRSYTVVVQGQRADDSHANTSIHLILEDLRPDVTSLERGITKPPAESSFGPNVHGLNNSYVGPHAHPGATNQYHYQVFALDLRLDEMPGTSFEKLLADMRGHVLAAGEVIGLATYDPSAPDAVTALPGPLQLDSGPMAGGPGRDASITVFKGVPYAAPPVANLRFRAPETPAKWVAVYKADHFSKSCPQSGGDPANLSEDCLYANIWTGSRSSAERRPVFVWIYGGGFSGGSGSDPLFDGEALALKGVVVVTFNYRLGALGFLATPELSRESGHSASGNYGLLDDIALLQWVQRNIQAFGGDPKKVTIGGQSAGAGSVGFLSMSPLAKGLFLRGIQESHARYSHDTELRYLSISYRMLKNAEESGAKLAASLGARSPTELRALPWSKLVATGDLLDEAVETGSNAKPPLFRPVLDGWLLPKTYNETYKTGTQNDVAILAGNNRDETGAVPEFAFARLRSSKVPPRGGSPSINLTLADYQRYAHRKFGSLAEQFLMLYPAATDDEAAAASNDAARDNSRIATYLWALDWRQHNHQPLYTYYWTHRPTGSPGGAFHGSEIRFVFHNLDLVKQTWTEEDRKVADTVSSYWVNFISSGNPNANGLAPWPIFDPKRMSVMELGDHFALMPITAESKLEFWKRFFATQPAW